MKSHLIFTALMMAVRPFYKGRKAIKTWSQFINILYHIELQIINASTYVFHKVKRKS